MNSETKTLIDIESALANEADIKKLIKAVKGENTPVGHENDALVDALKSYLDLTQAARKHLNYLKENPLLPQTFRDELPKEFSTDTFEYHGTGRLQEGDQIWDFLEQCWFSPLKTAPGAAGNNAFFLRRRKVEEEEFDEDASLERLHDLLVLLGLSVPKDTLKGFSNEQVIEVSEWAVETATGATEAVLPKFLEELLAEGGDADDK